VGSVAIFAAWLPRVSGCPPARPCDPTLSATVLVSPLLRRARLPTPHIYYIPLCKAVVSPARVSYPARLLTNAEQSAFVEKKNRVP